MQTIAPKRNKKGRRMAVVSDLSGQLVKHRINEVKLSGELGRAIRSELESGASIDSISAASKLPVDEVRRLAKTQQSASDSAFLAGIA